MPDNKGQVIKIAEREEKRLTRSGLLNAFNQEFEKMLSHGALVELTDLLLFNFDHTSQPDTITVIISSRLGIPVIFKESTSVTVISSNQSQCCSYIY